MPPKRNGRYKLPVPLPEGKVLDDTEGRQWVLGKMIGCGGFGLIYLAFPTNKPDEDAKHVVKVEYQENGPLFSELKFYQRAAKQECIKRWIAVKQLDYLGIPRFYGSGLTTFKEKSYRFMVMERLGIDLQKLSDRNGTFGKSAVLQLGIRMLDVLEYIHENEYIHGDIKAANLLLGYKNPDRVYLADYGLSYRYCPNGNHKQYQENPRKGHNGTMEFTSLDAHKGVALSRRSDLEILGYCLLRWLCGELPWERDLQDPRAVQIAKTNLLDELPDSVFKWAPSGSHCREIAQFLQCAHSLAYNEKPDYQMLKKILNPGGVPLGPLELSIHRPSADALRPGSQKVDSRKPAKQLAHQTQDKLRERKVGGRRSVASCVPLRPGQGDEELGALVSSETAQESARRRQKYQEPQDDLSDTNSSLQQSRGVPSSDSPDHHRRYGSSPGRNSTSLPPNWDTYDTLMTDTGVTELESSEALWPPISQFTLSEETKTAVCFYGFLILILLMLIFLVSYFL